MEAAAWIAEQTRNAMKELNQLEDKKPALSYWHVWTDEKDNFFLRIPGNVL